MTKFYTILGGIITILYIIVLAVFLFDRFPSLATMSLNEIGDFLTGIFGPIAFLWLVLGYLQQGVELAQNTKALELQALELKNSVQQQRELVELSKKQFQAEIDSLQLEMSRIEETHRPRFVVVSSDVAHPPNGPSEFGVSVVNRGADVTDVNIEFTPTMAMQERRSLSCWNHGQEQRLQFGFVEDKVCDFELIFAYVNCLGKHQERRVQLQANRFGQHPELSATQGDCV